MKYIDILITIYRNYDLLDLQVAHWKRFYRNGGWGTCPRLFVCDNTPVLEQKPINPCLEPYIHRFFRLDVGGIDGETHGAAIDALVRESNLCRENECLHHRTEAFPKEQVTNVIGIVDSDFFWLDSWTLERVYNEFVCSDSEIAKYLGPKIGGTIGPPLQAYGCAGFYPDWQNVLDPRHPDRAGALAPVCWGMFTTRELASKFTFVSSAEEARNVHETGWRLRKHMIDNDVPRKVLPGLYPEGWYDKECCFFGSPDNLEGVHILKGSAGRSGLTGRIPELIERFWH